MAKIYILITLLPQLFCTLVRGQESPCPQYFKYMTKSGETIGQIEIQSPPKTGQLRLRIILKLAAKLPTKYVGRLDLARSTEDSARDVLAGRNLLYYVYFPLRYPIPTLFGIWFNGEKYCSGPEATGRITTTITLTHTLNLPNMPSQISEPIRSHQTSWPTPKRGSTSKQATVILPRRFGNNIVLNIIPNDLSLQYSNDNNQKPNSVQTVPQYSNNNNNNNNNNHTNYDITPKPTQAPQWPPSTKRVPQPSSTIQTYTDDNNNNECGISSRSGNTNLLIANGRKTMPGEWPWLAILFVLENNKYKFLCGGSILTNKHILTAGHCLKLNFTTNETIHHNVLEVALGRFNLHQFHEIGTENREVASYTIHPEYAHADTGDSDLAILTLRTPVEYSLFIKPICLWSGPIDLQNIVNKSGYVVGWGKDEVGHPWTEDPRMAIMPIVNTEDCHWRDPTYVTLTSKRTFCAGKLDGTGPCNGDSGSGLVIFDPNRNRYQLRGVVSRSVSGIEPAICDLTKFTVFVDVAKYLSWIQLQIS